MGLFRRRQKGPMDPALTSMTVEDADALRAATLSALAGRGVTATADGGRVTCENGTVVDLWNLATVCAAAERDTWPEVITEHLDRALPRSAASPADMTDVELLGLVKYRLAEESYIRFMPERPADVVDFAPGIARHLVVDTTESVTTVPASTLLDKAPIEALREAADANTRTILDDDWRSERSGEGDAAVHLIVGESFFTATLALYLPDVVHRIVPGADLTRGVIFAVPSRHQLAFHIPTDGAVVRELVPTLLRYAGHGYDEGAGPISPHLYHWQDGTVTAFTAPADGPVLTATGALADLLGTTGT